MLILFVGVLDFDWSTNYSMQKVLERLGHNVVPFNYRTISAEFDTNKKPNAFDKWLDKGASFLRSDRMPINADWYYRRHGRKEMNQLLLKTVSEGTYDVVILSKTDTVDYNLLPEINKYSPTWYFFMDWMHNALSINAKEYAKRCTWSSASYSDVTKLFKKYNANSFFLTQGFDKKIFFPNGNAKKEDVVFVGTANKRRLRIINYLKNNGINVKCFGTGWDKGPIYREQLAETYRRAKIILNLQHGHPRKQGIGFSVRVFEAMATGSFLLSEYCPDLEKPFKQGKHLDWFRDQDEMLKKIHYYLSNDVVSARIARSGCDHVHKNHSWETVMQSIIDITKNRNNKIID